MKRCRWLNLNNKEYVKYHDTEWGKPNYNDNYLFEMLTLEMFQAGLAFECVLNKREEFKKALDNFDYNKISKYDENKYDELINNKKIIRNKLKIKALINNAKIFIQIQNEFKTFSNYIWSFTNNQIIKRKSDINITKNNISDIISKDLKKRGMKFIGSIMIYSYLQAIGIINDHDLDCSFK